MKNILIVEDDPDIGALERDYLEAAGFSVTVEGNGTTGLTLALSGRFDLAVLDVMLPGTDGMTICRSVRAASDMPIVMVTAKGEDVDKIRALGLGADDYVEKPFSPSVLVARIKAHLARYDQLKGTVSHQIVEAGPVRIDTGAHAVEVEGKPVSLRNKEYELLLYLARNAGMVLSRDQLYGQVWGSQAYGDAQTVPVHIKRIRQKIEQDPSNPVIIETVRGAGYRLRA
ncbi:MAG: response regulator transcription factor [Eggerthellaceae bacterium]|jgi:DNA-binding response OmpR family regulator